MQGEVRNAVDSRPWLAIWRTIEAKSSNRRAN